MNNINKTLYIPLYGKAYVSRLGLFLSDKRAEEIWEAEGFLLKGRSKSKWLAYYMGIRSRVFDDWAKSEIEKSPDAVVIHIGCGMDPRVSRMGEEHPVWYDIDFPDVIAERKRHFEENDRYRMIGADVREVSWLDGIENDKKAIVLAEGVSMYLSQTELVSILDVIGQKFASVALLMDCYTSFAAKMSKYKNPINDVGVRVVHGVDDPGALSVAGILYSRELEMTPKCYVDELRGFERWIFSKLYAGNFSKKLYKLYEYRK